MIKNIILDIGDVLVSFRWRELMKELGFSEEQIKILSENMFATHYWSEWDRGYYTEEQVIAAIKEKSIGLEQEVERFFEHKGELVNQFDYTEAWIKALKQRGYKVFLLSNYPISIFEAHAKETFTFLPLVDGKVVSGYVKMIKPEPGIYKCLLETYQLKAEECVFIDDNKDNVQGAKEVGIRAIRFWNYDQAVSELEALLSQ